MKIATTGSKGKIGRRLAALGAIPLNCDILDKNAVERELHRVNPDVVIHAAGISSIDACEDDYEKALAVNVWGTANLCKLAENKVVLLSSDQVYGGKRIFGKYSEKDEPKPINNYGFTKFGAEAVVNLYGGKTIRLARGFSYEINSDIWGYIDNLRQGKEVKVPTFIKRNYCHLDFVAQAIMEFANHVNNMPKVTNYGSENSMSFYDFMCAVSKAYFRNDRFVARRTSEIAGYSPRPRNCSMGVSLAKSVGLPIHSISESIELMKKEEFHV